MAAQSEVFKAIADSTRRDIFHLLMSGNEAKTINEIAGEFSSTRQAVTKHIKILNSAGLIDIKAEGRERHCYANPEPLKLVYNWIGAYEKFWDQKLENLGTFLDSKKEK